MASSFCLDWLRYARMDIDVAQQLYTQQQNVRQRPIEVIMYHCQQGVEKALKAYIAEQGVQPPHKHDLQLLRTQCSNYNRHYTNARIVNHCDYLNAFSVVVRYPSHRLSLDSGDAVRGLNSAKRVYDFVSEQLGLRPVYFR